MVGRIRPAGAPATVKVLDTISPAGQMSLVHHSRLQARQAARLSSPKSSPSRQATADPEPLENRTVDWRIRSASLYTYPVLAGRAKFASSDGSTERLV